MFDKGAKNTQQRKEDSLLNKWCWNNWIFTWKRMKLGPYLTPPRINMVKDLNIRPAVMKHLEDNLAINLLDMTLGGNVWMGHLQHRQQNEK